MLQGAFERENVPKLEEEIGRLFRSNAFNISARRRAEDERREKYKDLEEAPKTKESTEQLIKRMEKRFAVPKANNRQSYLKAKTEIRPLFNRLTPHGAVNTRSPLVSMIFPSLKDKITMF